MMNFIRVAIVDNLTFCRDGIRKILDGEDDIKVVGEASDGIEALQVAEDKKPDVMLLDNKPNINSLEVIRLIKQRGLETRVLLLMEVYDEDAALSALQMGAIGCLLKTETSLELIKAIRMVRRGEVWVKRHMIGNLIKKFSPKHSRGVSKNHSLNNKLTKKQIEIIKFVVVGCSNKEIARRLFISEKTVKSHLYNIFKKLNVKRRVQLSTYQPLLANNHLKESKPKD
ncbi:MAG: LuxR C-terminal-related transcriptional regulator [Thermodesulfobacteriota bacterium]